MENENNWSDITDSLGNVAKKINEKINEEEVVEFDVSEE